MNNSISIKWKKLHQEAKIPSVQSKGAACFDLSAALDEDMVIHKGQVAAIPTGLSVEIPEGYELQIRARSGLAFKHGFTLVNGIGTIDSDYRGELKVLATLLADETLTIKNGDRIAQALVSKLTPVEHVQVEVLSDTERGVGGFGSTGVKTEQTTI